MKSNKTSDYPLSSSVTQGHKYLDLLPLLDVLLSLRTMNKKKVARKLFQMKVKTLISIQTRKKTSSKS